MRDQFGYSMFIMINVIQCKYFILSEIHVTFKCDLFLNVYMLLQKLSRDCNEVIRNVIKDSAHNYMEDPVLASSCEKEVGVKYKPKRDVIIGVVKFSLCSVFVQRFQTCSWKQFQTCYYQTMVETICLNFPYFSHKIKPLLVYFSHIHYQNGYLYM